MHDDNQHYGEDGQKHARNQFEQESLNPVVKLQQDPVLRIRHCVIAEMIGVGEIGGCWLSSRLRLVLRTWELFVCALRVILRYNPRHL